MNPNGNAFFQSKAIAEPKATIAVFIIPPETSIDIKSTRTTNLSKIELEVTLRISDKIQEVAINV